jgi:4-methylaminobutanoate oxidase (formaldehyde-forming)
MLWGGELVLHDGAPAGQVSSAAWSATCGAAVGLAYVWRRDSGPVMAEDLASGTWEVMVGDQVTPMNVQLGALYDPTSARVRG